MISVPILESQNAGSQGLRVGLLSGGAAVAGVGVVALVAGLWLWMHNDTTIHEEASPSASARRSPMRVTPSGLLF
jgi:hypothetical protein